MLTKWLTKTIKQIDDLIIIISTLDFKIHSKRIICSLDAKREIEPKAGGHYPTI